MPANNAKSVVHYWQGLYGGLGHLYSPGALRATYPWLPYALDNGAYGAFMRKESFNGDAFIKHCDLAAQMSQSPLWIVVPDSVGDKKLTIEMWPEWSARLQLYGWPLAFAAQDGMTPRDVPENASIVFIGGSTQWKRDNIKIFCDAFKRVHVGRINTRKWLWYCHQCGVESVDGTGWFRGDLEQYNALHDYLRSTSRPASSEIDLDF